MLKHKIKLAGGSYTVDEEFNDLEKEVTNMDSQIKKLMKYIKMFVEATSQTLNNSVVVAETFQNLIDPYCNLKYDSHVLQGAFDIWNEISSYKHIMKQVNVDTEMRDLTEVLVKKLEEYSSLLKNVFKQISARQMALLDLDKVLTDHENLLLKQEQAELTLIQSNSLYSLKRKLDDNSVKYNKINSLLKKELPIFIKLGKNLIGNVQVGVYYCHLVCVYELSSKLGERYPLQQDVKAIIRHFLRKNEPVAHKFEQSSLISSSPEMNPTKEKTVYCRALYNFDGIEKTDLSIKTNDKIKLLEYDGDWWTGELNGEIGVFPSNYVQLE
ncbi:hypothetical protein G210_5468 [Candida maltosa Xu316]|uniref:SH3 domain-containing protein n=1 Tax=Candida maltosa (strain Xu316) TaxID=1245528 RepID=M3HQE5_CANMX|nr:hypothetical protein G210_5468 [Candida maltosa Xu316]